MKKYKIRKFSPAWWITRVGGVVITCFNLYVICVFIMSMEV